MLIPILSLMVMAKPPADEVRHFAVGVEGELAPAMPVTAGPVALAPPSLALTWTARRPWGLQLLAGAGYASVTTDTPLATTVRQVGVSTSLRALWWPLRWDRARVGLLAQAGYRGRFGGEDAEFETSSFRAHGFAVGAGVRPEWFVVPRLSLHTQLGVAFTFDDDNTTQTRQQLLLAGNVLGQAGVSIWF